jgi:hypothetical protein
MCSAVVVGAGTSLVASRGRSAVSNMDTNRSGKRKAKATVHPRSGHEGPEVEYRYSSTLSLTSALDGDGWSSPRLGRFTPGKDPVPIV